MFIAAGSLKHAILCTECQSQPPFKLLNKEEGALRGRDAARLPLQHQFAPFHCHPALPALVIIAIQIHFSLQNYHTLRDSMMFSQSNRDAHLGKGAEREHAACQLSLAETGQEVCLIFYCIWGEHQPHRSVWITLASV